ncbi:ABC transporter ATP-binding protein [Haloferax sp. Atlit-10N]|uniref:ABC-type antimicrobial peptide transport system, ATPase component n=1 Tax=Haloferax prahovense (strain DSM 18310 / JCM 13924 / TL6) TaxID=1227461 RepID=M0G102_HALPT|nr:MULTISPECIES: ABC transporter ATP-binding protein [Haloferax]ELZ65956.1 ABC-type antimicrobial peptide transport system, ATPase component [Haloferax prahovense DSM 18310]RDZ44815.1 ABC transporter ATP-binding protein [Haloferax sp. Atlit-16N]RDZ48165.1 ABC transporter ATP-binding protein [Haloferax sp. Atlit-19N]RDZ59406.1 ABC transporter ATP-binding protein [Haloferax sp. Atlit-10N]
MTGPVLRGDSLTVERGDSTILADVSITVEPDTSLLIQGPSGAGKTTLFNVLGLLSTPTSGSLYVHGDDTSALPERKRAVLRRDALGFVFQDFQLIPDLTAWDNAALPQDHTRSRDEAWLDTLFDALDILDLKDQYPATLSGGEKQRVAIARALANRPDVVFADEPTGQLDPETAARVLDLLFRVKDQTDTALVVISHDPTLSDQFEETHVLIDGSLRRKPDEFIRQ